MEQPDSNGDLLGARQKLVRSGTFGLLGPRSLRSHHARFAQFGSTGGRTEIVDGYLPTMTRRSALDALGTDCSASGPGTAKERSPAAHAGERQSHCDLGSSVVVFFVSVAGLDRPVADDR